MKLRKEKGGRKQKNADTSTKQPEESVEKYPFRLELSEISIKSTQLVFSDAKPDLINDLLQKILTHLPLNQLLPTARVAKPFHYAIRQILPKLPSLHHLVRSTANYDTDDDIKHPTYRMRFFIHLEKTVTGGGQAAMSEIDHLAPYYVICENDIFLYQDAYHDNYPIGCFKGHEAPVATNCVITLNRSNRTYVSGDQSGQIQLWQNPEPSTTTHVQIKSKPRLFKKREKNKTNSQRTHSTTASVLRTIQDSNVSAVTTLKWRSNTQFFTGFSDGRIACYNDQGETIFSIQDDNNKPIRALRYNGVNEVQYLLHNGNIILVNAYNFHVDAFIQLSEYHFDYNMDLYKTFSHLSSTQFAIYQGGSNKYIVYSSIIPSESNYYFSALSIRAVYPEPYVAPFDTKPRITCTFFKADAQVAQLKCHMGRNTKKDIPMLVIEGEDKQTRQQLPDTPIHHLLQINI